VPIGATAPVERAMVQPAQRHGELIARPASERSALGKPQMVRDRRPPTAQQAWLQSHELEVIAVAVAAYRLCRVYTFTRFRSYSRAHRQSL